MSPHPINLELEKNCKMAVGKIVKHPSGKMVKIISGQFLSNGRVSNFWYWKTILKNGKLSRKKECGYGWI